MLDLQTDLQYNHARWYDSTMGRWIGHDPIGFDAGDSNLYRYVNNQPTDRTDPSGLDDDPAASRTWWRGFWQGVGAGISVSPTVGTFAADLLAGPPLFFKSSGASSFMALGWGNARFNVQGGSGAPAGTAKVDATFAKGVVPAVRVHTTIKALLKGATNKWAGSNADPSNDKGENRLGTTTISLRNLNDKGRYEIEIFVKITRSAGSSIKAATVNNAEFKTLNSENPLADRVGFGKAADGVDSFRIRTVVNVGQKELEMSKKDTGIPIFEFVPTLGTAGVSEAVIDQKAEIGIFSVKAPNKKVTKYKIPDLMPDQFPCLNPAK